MKKTIFIIPLLALIMTSCGGSGEQNPTGPIGPTQGPATSGVGPSTDGVGPTSGSSSSTSQGNQPEVVSVSLNKDFIEINLNDDDKTAVLVASVEVKNNAPKSVTYTTTNDHIAHVTSAGIVIGTGSGYATIRATSTYDATKYAECTVRVKRPQQYVFDPTSVIMVGTNNYSASAVSSQGSINFIMQGVTFIENRFCIEDEAFFYNITPIEGIDNASYTMQAVSSRATISSFLSYNELFINDILGAKYSDLYSFVSGYSNFTDVYGERTIAFSQSEMPSLKNYRYFFIHIKVQSDPIYISNMSVYNDHANIPEIPVGENEGVYTSEEIALINSKTNNAVSSLTKAGNGAFTIAPYSYFGINQFVPLEGRSYFESDLISSGFTLSSSSSDAYYLYQKQVGDKVHSFVVQYQNLSMFRWVDISYSDEYSFIVRTETWPAEFLNENLREEHSSLFPTLVSSKIEAFECSTTGGLDKQVTINAIIKDGQTFTEADLNDYLALFNPANFYGSYSIDGLLHYQIFFTGPQRVTLILTEFAKSLVPPTALDIATSLNIPNYASSIVTFAGGDDSYYNCSTPSTSIVFNFDEDDILLFKSDLESHGYEMDVSNVYRKCVDIYDSYIQVEINPGPVPNSYIISYSFTNNESQFIQYSSFADVLDNWSNQGYFSNETITSLKENISTLPSYVYRGYENKFFVLNAGSEFIDQLASACEITGQYYSDFNLYYFENENNNYVFIKVIDEGVMLYVGNRHMEELYDYTKFNQRMDNWGAPSKDVFYLDEEDQLPNHFVSQGFIGTLEEVNHVYEVLLAKITATGSYTYSRLLNKYIDKDNNRSIQLYIPDYPTYQGSDIYSLIISFGSDEYEDFQSYNSYPVTSESEVIDFMAHFPDLMFDKDDDIVARLVGSPTSMVFEVEGRDLSYRNALIEAGFVGDFSSLSKIIDGKLYYVHLEDRIDTVRYEFYDYGQLLSSTDAYNYDSNNYHDLLDAFAFTTYFNSPSPSYAVYNVELGRRFDFITTSEHTQEVEDYRNYLYESGYVDMEGKLVKYLDQYQTSYQSVLISNGDIIRVSFEIVDYHYQTWSNFVASLTEYDVSEHSSLVAFPTVYGDEQVFSLVNEEAESLSFNVLGVVSMNEYMTLLRNHQNFDHEGTGVFDTNFYFNDGSIVQIISSAYTLGEYYIVNITSPN